jgi:hypothetical protein
MALICQISQKPRLDSECCDIHNSYKQQAGPVSAVIRILDFRSFLWLVLWPETDSCRWFGQCALKLPEGLTAVEPLRS